MIKLIACLAFLLNALLLCLPAAAEQASPHDAFYTVSPEDLTGPPGTLIRAEPIEIMSVYRANAYRILYVSRNLKGEKIGVSGLAVVSTLSAGGATRPAGSPGGKPFRPLGPFARRPCGPR